MITPLVIEQIFVDVYFEGECKFSVNQFTLLDLRRQIIQKQLEGYSLKMNPSFYHLFTEEDNIAECEIFIYKNGEVSDWFPEYDINEEYTDISVFNESLAGVIKLNQALRGK